MGIKYVCSLSVLILAMSISSCGVFWMNTAKVTIKSEIADSVYSLENVYIVPIKADAQASDDVNISHGSSHTFEVSFFGQSVDYYLRGKLKSVGTVSNDKEICTISTISGGEEREVKVDLDISGTSIDFKCDGHEK